jgi:hypothetical protein
MPEIETSGALLEVARSFRPRILAERDRIEASRRLPYDLARELAHAGFFRIFLPTAYGGLDLTPMDAMEIFEELARADVSEPVGIKARPSFDGPGLLGASIDLGKATWFGPQAAVGHRWAVDTSGNCGGKWRRES